MRTIILDIETAPDITPDMEKWLYDKKYSKITVPKKVQDKGDEAVAEHMADKAAGIIPDMYDKASLRSTTGKIICLGLCFDGDPSIFYHPGYSEKEMLDALWECFTPGNWPRLVTFNGFSFDLPFCIQRSRLLGVSIPPGVQKIYLDRYSKDKIHYDIMREWTCGVYGEYISLYELCLAFGVEPPKGDGADIAKLYEDGNMDAIIDHNKSDLIATWEIYQRMEGSNVSWKR